MEHNAGLASNHEAAFGVFVWALSALRFVAAVAREEEMGPDASLAFAIALALSWLLARDAWRRWAAYRRREIAVPPRSGHPYR